MNIVQACRSLPCAFAVLAALGPASGCGPTSEEDRAAAALKSLGAEVRSDENEPGKPVYNVNLKGLSATDAHMKEVGKLRHLHYPNLAGTEISEEGLKELANLRELRGLTTYLESLDLSDTAVTDAGLRSLHGLKHLTWVGLAGTEVTDAGVKELRAARPLCEVER